MYRMAAYDYINCKCDFRRTKLNQYTANLQGSMRLPPRNVAMLVCSFERFIRYKLYATVPGNSQFSSNRIYLNYTPDFSNLIPFNFPQRNLLSEFVVFPLAGKVISNLFGYAIVVTHRFFPQNSLQSNEHIVQVYIDLANWHWYICDAKWKTNVLKIVERNRQNETNNNENENNTSDAIRPTIYCMAD